MRHILVSLVLLVVSTQASAAYYGVLDNGEVLEQGKYKVTTMRKFSPKNGGLNLGAMFEMGFKDEFGIKALAGFGKTDVYAGGMA